MVKAWEWQQGEFCSIPHHNVPSLVENSITAVFTTFCWPLSVSALGVTDHIRRLWASSDVLGWPVPCQPNNFSHSLQQWLSLAGAKRYHINIILNHHGQVFVVQKPFQLEIMPTQLTAQKYLHVCPRIKHNHRVGIQNTVLQNPHPVWINEKGHLLESPIATVGGFLPLQKLSASKYALWLPPKAECLKSLTRRKWLNTARQLNLPVLERPLSVTEAQKTLHGLMLGNCLRGTWAIQELEHTAVSWKPETLALFHSFQTEMF